MLETKKRNVLIVSNVVAVIFFMAISYFILKDATFKANSLYFIVLESMILLFSLIIAVNIAHRINRKIEDSTLKKAETALLQEFIDKLRFCYSLDDLYEVIKSVLEMRADCSALYIDSTKNYVLYSSTAAVTSDPETIKTVESNFPQSWPEGYHFIGDTFGMVSSYNSARGFFLCSNGHHFFIFCRYTRLIEYSIYKTLYEEFVRFRKRAETITGLSEIASLSKEWEQLAETQKLFLPQTMPEIHRLKVAAYFRPLVNVSGDYYTVLPIDKHRTLLMLGDVSGKGLPAALIMGLVMNTVKIIDDKEDLIGIVHAVDKAIKGMKLQDKYTVLFISIVDTHKMTIRYVNASMSDPLIVTRAPDGYTIKPLTSNCGVVGIIDIDSIRIDEQKLFRDDLILFASDGVSEVMNEDGVELGDTELYTETIKRSAAKEPQEFVDDIVDLIFSYKGEAKLHDDITMMVSKVVG